VLVNEVDDEPPSDGEGRGPKQRRHGKHLQPTQAELLERQRVIGEEPRDRLLGWRRPTTAVALTPSRSSSASFPADRSKETPVFDTTRLLGPRVEPDGGGLELLVDDLLARTPRLSELVGATRFVLSVLNLTDDADIHQMILAG
jgi:hypothetical protein